MNALQICMNFIEKNGLNSLYYLYENILYICYKGVLIS